MTENEIQNQIEKDEDEYALWLERDEYDNDEPLLPDDPYEKFYICIDCTSPELCLSVKICKRDIT